MLVGVLVALAAGVAAYAVAVQVRAHAVSLGLVQVPDARASHTLPTPTGGGIGIAVGGTLGAVPAIQADPSVAAVALAAITLAGLGLLDDRRPVAALVRLGAQALLAALVVALAMPAVEAGWAMALGALAIVVWVNVFNFMDGIDGLAGSQAVFMLVGAALLAAGYAGGEAPVLWWMVALAAATLGFLVLNWPPARIFMGDAGSTYLGLAIASVALYAIALGWLTPWQWMILGAVFGLDASMTLARRLVRGDAVFRGHRLHGYQHLARRLGGHRPVTLIAIAVNVGWLLPVAWWAGANPDLGWLATLVGWVPVILGLFWARAGAPESPAASDAAAPRTSS